MKNTQANKPAKKKYNVERAYIRKVARLNNLTFKHIAANGCTHSHYVFINRSGIVRKVCSTFKAALYFTLANGLQLLKHNPAMVCGSVKRANDKALTIWLARFPTIGALNSGRFYIIKNGEYINIKPFQTV